VVDLVSAIRAHARLGLDTAVFVYQIEAVPPFVDATDSALHEVRRRSVTAVTSVLTLSELLVQPLRLGRRGLAARYEALVRAIPNLSVVDVDGRIARRSAGLRATYRLRTVDAVQIATALEHGATAFLTNDRRLRQVEDITLIVLGDHLNG
jgi:predicted nucleic acid-binding protein